MPPKQPPRQGPRTKQKPPFQFPRTPSYARPYASLRQLRYWVQTFHSTQRYRIVGSNRQNAWERGMDTAEEVLSPQARLFQTHAETLEATALDEINQILATMPIWTDWLQHIKGIGPALGGQLLSMLLPPQADRTVAIWFKAAGLDVVNPPAHSEAAVDSEHPVASDAWVDPVSRLVSDTRIDSDSVVASTKAAGPTTASTSEAEIDSVKVAASERGVDSETAVAHTNQADERTTPHHHPAQSNPLTPHIPRYTAGVLPTWHPALRRTCYLIGESLVTYDGYFRHFYDEWKLAYIKKHTTGHTQADVTPAHYLDYRLYLLTTQAKKPELWISWLAHRLKVSPFILEHDNHGTLGLDWPALEHTVYAALYDRLTFTLSLYVNPKTELQDEKTRQQLRDSVLQPTIATVTTTPQVQVRQVDRPWRVIDRTARWRTVKLLLSMLWYTWAQSDSIPCRLPYPISMLGHRADHYREPPRPEEYHGKKI